MKEIILIIAICGLFIFFFWFLFNISKKNKKPKEKKNEKKDEPKHESQKKEDIPDVLKEITTGNYMHDLAKDVSTDGIVMQENESLGGEEPKTVLEIEKEFDYIDSMGDDMDGILDDEIDEVGDSVNEIEDIADEIDDIAADIYDIEKDLDNALGEDFGKEEKDSKQNTQSLAEEIKNSSNSMKALLIANILDKKHK